MAGQIGADQRLRLMRLASSFVLDELRPEVAVELAASLIADGIESDATLQLAMMSPDPRQLTRADVEPLVRSMLSELGVPIPSPADGWETAKFLAEAMIAGWIAPATGAFRLWELWDVCGEPNDELTWMLQLHDAWVEAVGSERDTIELEMVRYAPKVIAAANRKAADWV